MTFKDLYGDKSNEVYYGDLDISEKGLTSLEGCYKRVEGYFDCSRNELTSFEHCPDVDGYFNCHNNKITSFKYCPDIKGNFYCGGNQITSFEYCPDINGDFNCNHNQITSFENKYYYPNVKLDEDIKERYIEFGKKYFPQYFI